eukprot:TRINITY_DN6896_c0_g1_i1.p1 TRINITY_DN6896_c0_g1~~TRINITY_DN6896_c0_g1_i1.p1  ORF type:complete len:558 (-),score=84.11 TRINITY_DN6896_c0_g1_i1:166-1839(-)
MRRITPSGNDVFCSDEFCDAPRPIEVGDAWHEELPGTAAHVNPPDFGGALSGTEAFALGSAALARLERQLTNMQYNIQKIIKELQEEQSLALQATVRTSQVPSSPSGAPPKVHLEARELHVVPAEAKPSAGKITTTMSSVVGVRKMTALPDVEYMKEKVREAVMKPPYNVADLYKTEGWCQSIARSTCFENITLFVIALNAFWMSIDVDYNKAVVLSDSAVHFQIVENVFCAYFSGEILIRFFAFSRKMSCVRDGWFVFDASLAILMVLETWIWTLVASAFGVNQEIMLSGQSGVLKSVKLLRLFRTGRMVRLVRAMPELMFMIKGIFVATRSMILTFGLLLIVTYVFSIICVQLADDTDAARVFPSMPITLAFLLLNATLPDHAATWTDLFDVSPLLAWLFLIFTLFSFVTVMNMLVGILVEVVTCVAAVEKEQLNLTFVKERLEHMLQAVGVDTDGDGFVNKSEFKTLMFDEIAVRTIRSLDIDVMGLIEILDFIFLDVDGLSFSEFMDLVLHLRGNNPATVKDVVDLRKFLHLEMTQILQAQADMINSMKKEAP